MNEIICGAFLEGTIYTPIVCNTDTGEVHYTSAQGLELLLGEISITDPTSVDMEEVESEIREGTFGKNVVGLIYTDTGVYVLTDDDLCTIMNTDGTQREGATPFAYDTNCEYETEGDE